MSILCLGDWICWVLCNSFSSIFELEEEFICKGHATQWNFQLNKDKVRGNTLDMSWDYEVVKSSINTTAKKTLKFYSDRPFHVKQIQTWTTRTSLDVLPSDWLNASTARVVPSLQLTKLRTIFLHLTLNKYFRILDQEFFCIHTKFFVQHYAQLAHRQKSTGYRIFEDKSMGY